MTTTFNDVALNLKARPATSASSAQSNIVTYNGKQYKIKLEMLVDGVWKEVDTSRFSRNEFERIMETCQKIYEETTDGTSHKSLTVYLQQNTLPESWSSTLIGKFFDSWKDKDLQKLEFVKLEYTTEESDKPEVVGVKTHKFSEPEILTLHSQAQTIIDISKAIFSNPEQFIKDERAPLPKPKPAPVQNSPLAECIKDAGSKDNRCASLSLAQRELAKSNPQDIVEKYNLAPGLTQKLTDALEEKDKIKLLSEALIAKAVTAIGTNPDFRDASIQGYRRPGLNAINRALEEYQQSQPDFPIPSTPDDKVAIYTSLMMQQNFMLDLPFFLALEQPFIIIRKVNDAYIITEIGHQYTISNTLENCDVEDVNIVYFDGKNHYQSVILSTDDQKAEMRKLIRKEIDGQINAVADLLVTKDLGVEGQKVETTSMLALIQLYPKAKQELIEKLKTQYPKRTDNFNGVLFGSTDDNFAEKLRLAIYGPIVNEAP